MYYVVNVTCKLYLCRDGHVVTVILHKNKALKYKFLPRKSVSLSCITTIIIERFLPEQYRNYLFLNFQMDPSYRAYNTHIPPYLRARPRNYLTLLGT